MGKFLSIIGGILAILIGIFFLIKWLNIVIMGLKFCIVIALLFGGLMAVLFGIIEIRDERELKKMEQEEKK
ncbi:MAG TPA: hypothetical protein PKV48_04060 [Thermodesulfobacteriota bacterium]|nr:hypothetical protein [Thermodesulfobacteriota bacterium]